MTTERAVRGACRLATLFGYRRGTRALRISLCMFGGIGSSRAPIGAQAMWEARLTI